MSQSSYYSYVINIANAPPYDQLNYRALTWVGHFVKPIVENQLHDHYWFSFYGDHAKLRIWTSSARHDSLVPIINKLLEHPALSRRLDTANQPVEANLSLVEDLGSDRFRLNDCSHDRQLERAISVLRVLHSLCDLVIHSLKVTQDGHFFIEANENRLQNPDGSSFQSLHHLFCLITQVPTFVWAATDKIPLTDFQISALYEQNKLKQTDVAEIQKSWKRLNVVF